MNEVTVVIVMLCDPKIIDRVHQSRTAGAEPAGPAATDGTMMKRPRTN